VQLEFDQPGNLGWTWWSVRFLRWQLRHVTGGASRLREQIPVAIPAPTCRVKGRIVKKFFGVMPLNVQSSGQLRFPG